MKRYLVIFPLFICVLSSVIPAATIYVSETSSAVDPNGSSWETAYQTIQEGVDAANPYDTVLVNLGTYYENVVLGDKPITLTGIDPNEPGTVAATVIDGGGSGSVLSCTSGSLTNDTADTLITGFRIQNGSGNSSGNGAGLDCWRTYPVIKNCIFYDNAATGSFGGGIFCYFGEPTILNCTFLGNSSGAYGGGLACYQSDITVRNCVFSGNNSDRGGGFASYESDTIVTNCTFSRNTSAYGGAIYARSNTLVVVNSILWDNSATDSGDEIDTLNSSLTVSHSVIEDGKDDWDINNNIFNDPLFVDADGMDDTPGTRDDDLHVDPYSICINAGDDTDDYAGQTGMDSEDRVLYGRVDIGADEVFPIGADLNADEEVDIADVILFADGNNWLVEADMTTFAKFAGQWMYGYLALASDLNGDGQVDLTDLMMFVDSESWLVDVYMADFSVMSSEWLIGVE